MGNKANNIFLLGEKRGLEAKVLVSLIIAIAGFAIILIAFSGINWKNQINMQTCHESVIAKMTLPDTAIKSSKEIVPLKCQTKKICVTSKLFGKGNCEHVFGDDFITVRVRGSDSEKQEKIKKILADETAEMWSVMGQGKGQIFGREFKLKKESKKCIIYSRIYFDNTITTKIKEIRGLTKYLLENKMPNSEKTYYEFLFNSENAKNYDPLKDEFKISDGFNQKAIVFIEAGDTTAVRTIYTALMGAGTAGIGAKVGAVIGSFIVPGAGTVIGGAIGLGFGLVSGTFLGYHFGDQISADIIGNNVGYATTYMLIDYNADVLKNLECDSFENIS